MRQKDRQKDTTQTITVAAPSSVGSWRIEEVALELVQLGSDGDQVVVPEHAHGHGCW